MSDVHLSVEDLDPKLRTRCERYSRIMGYLRPVDAANPGKQQEIEDRVYYRADIS